MSHLEEREEKICLNCNTALVGRFCHVCGQENLEPKESFWHLLTHFVYDVTHFDGKFFSTLKFLLLRPGRLATEYSLGRRASYLHPIRMYVFASAIFFVVFFSFVAEPEEVSEAAAKGTYTSLAQAKQALKDSINSATDSERKADFTDAYDAINKIPGIAASKSGTGNDTLKKGAKTGNGKADEIHYTNNDGWKILIDDKKLPATMQQYDSLQQKLPPDKRDGWFGRMYVKRFVQIKQRYHGDYDALAKNFWDKFLHSIPQMMFVSVPFVALVLQLLYVRRRKQFYYVNHVIFMIYVYIAVFTSLLVYFGLGALHNATHFAPFGWLRAAVMIYIFLYCFLAMHNFYKQGYIKTFFKYFLLLCICFFLDVFIMSFFIFSSIMSV